MNFLTSSKYHDITSTKMFLRIKYCFKMVNCDRCILAFFIEKVTACTLKRNKTD